MAAPDQKLESDARLAEDGSLSRPSVEEVDSLLKGQLVDDQVFELGEDGRPLSVEESYVRRKMQRLLLLHHASECTHKPGMCPVTPHCEDIKGLWEHMASCADDNCNVFCCFSSRCFLTHYSACKNPACPSCKPAREAAKKSLDPALVQGWPTQLQWFDINHSSNTSPAARASRVSSKQSCCAKKSKPLLSVSPCTSEDIEDPPPPHHHPKPPLPRHRHHHQPPPCSSNSGDTGGYPRYPPSHHDPPSPKGYSMADSHCGPPPPTAASQHPTPSKAAKKYQSLSSYRGDLTEGKIMIRRKCPWKSFPELEAFLISNRDEYLRNAAMDYTAEQRRFNNRFTERLLELAARHNYVFDEKDFNFVAVRDRIRCYYKSYVQSSKKGSNNVFSRSAKPAAGGTPEWPSQTESGLEAIIISKIQDSRTSYRDIVDILSSNQFSAAVQEEALCKLSRMDLVAEELHNFINLGGIDAIVKGMQLHKSNARVQVASCLTLHNLSSTSDAQAAISSAGGVEAIMNAMSMFDKGTEVQEIAQAVLFDLGAHEEKHDFVDEKQSPSSMEPMRSAAPQFTGCGIDPYHPSLPPQWQYHPYYPSKRGKCSPPPPYLKQQRTGNVPIYYPPLATQQGYSRPPHHPSRLPYYDQPRVDMENHPPPTRRENYPPPLHPQRKEDQQQASTMKRGRTLFNQQNHGPSVSHPVQIWNYSTPYISYDILGPINGRWHPPLSLDEFDLDQIDPSPGTLEQIRELQGRPALRLCHEVGTMHHGLSYYLELLRVPTLGAGSVAGALVWDKVKIKEAASTDGRIFECLLMALEGALSQLMPGKASSLPSLPQRVHKALQNRKDRKALADQIIVDLNHSTLLHLAAGSETRAAVRLCQLLVSQFGADFDSIKDGAGRTARIIAIANKNQSMREWAESLGTLFGRYIVDVGPPVHKSETCEVKFAVDQGTTQESHRHIALKIVADRKQFEHELEIRLLANRKECISGKDLPSHFNRFNRSHAVELYRYHDDIDDGGREVMCLVMPRADRSLDDIIRSEHVAGREIHIIRHIAMSVAMALQHLHSDCGIVHGDLKTRNVLRFGSRFELIDFDASAKVGCPIFVKKASTAFCPPEIARVLFRDEHGGDLKALENRRDALNQDLRAIESSAVSKMFRSLCLDEIRATEGKILQLQAAEATDLKADPTADVWSFGVIMFQMLTGSSLFKCDDADNLDGKEEERKLVQWQGLRDSHLRRVLVNCPGANVSEIRDAKAMLKKCLMEKPSDRPQSMYEVLRMPFLNRMDDCKWTPGEKNCIRVLFSDPLAYLQNNEFHPIERLNFARERNVLMQSIKSTGKDVDVTFDAATDVRLQELAGKRCGVLHFSGHGLGWGLLFEDGCGGAAFVTVEKLQKLIPHHEPFKLVFVSACDSKCIGEAFVQAGVPHVLCCNKDSLLRDDAAAAFTRTFYCELVKGSTIKTAFDCAAGRVLVDEGEQESKKYTLLPIESDHDVSVFVADDIDDFEEENDCKRLLPAPPVDFSGHQKILYKIVHAIFSGEEKKHIISLVGESSPLRDNLVSAAFYYVNDRLSTAININEIFYVKATVGLDASTDGSLITSLCHQLSAEGRLVDDCGEDKIQNICEAIKGLKVLIIFDRIDEVSHSLRCLLRSSCEVAGTVKILLTCRNESVLNVPAAQSAIFIDKLSEDSTFLT